MVELRVLRLFIQDNDMKKKSRRLQSTQPRLAQEAERTGEGRVEKARQARSQKGKRNKQVSWSHERARDTYTCEGIR